MSGRGTWGIERCPTLFFARRYRGRSSPTREKARPSKTVDEPLRTRRGGSSVQLLLNLRELRLHVLDASEEAPRSPMPPGGLLPRIVSRCFASPSRSRDGVCRHDRDRRFRRSVGRDPLDQPFPRAGRTDGCRAKTCASRSSNSVTPKQPEASVQGFLTFFRFSSAQIPRSRKLCRRVEELSQPLFDVRADAVDHFVLAPHAPHEGSF